MTVGARSELAAAFGERAASVGTVTHATDRAEVVALVEGLLRAAAVRRVALDADARGALPELTEALTQADYVIVPADAAPASLAEADAGISWAAFGIAETGSVALATPGRGERLISMLPPLHLVLLRQSTVVADLDAGAERLRAWTVGGVRERYVSLVTGASRTSDIERVLTIGVHGPRAQHILLLTDE